MISSNNASKRCSAISFILPFYSLEISYHLYYMATQNDQGKGKALASWDSQTNKILIDCCVGEVRSNNKEGGHFNRIGWKNIVENFNNATGRRYDRKQLKNRYDTLRREWVLWDSLVGKETGLGWDPQRKTVQADNSWWDRKLAQFPKAAKFRVAGLENAFELDEIFRDIVANGSRAWAPISRSIPPLYENTNLGEDNDVHDDDSDSEGDNIQPTTPLDSISAGINLSVGQQKTVNKDRKRKKVSASARLSKQLDRICDDVESRTSTTTLIRRDIPGYSIKEVIEYMGTMPECPKRSPLFMVGAKLFKQRENREMFVALGDDETRLEWLKDEQRDMEAAAKKFTLF